MSALEGQLPLGLKVSRNASNAQCYSLATWGKALALTAGSSGFHAKSLALELDIDAAQFSRMVSGQLGIMPEKLFKLMDVCRTELPLMWLLYQRGYDVEALHRRETELERENRALKEEVAKLKDEREVITRFVRDARPA